MRESMAIPGPVLLTGATGFLGSHILDRLLERGVETTCLVRPSSDASGLEARGVALRRACMAGPSAELEAAVAGHATVIHAAGAIRALSTQAFLDANAGVTEALALACLASAPTTPRFVQVSSVGATGPAPLGSSLTEDQPPTERTDYGRSKWEAEQRLLAMRDRLPVVILRPTAIFGPRDKEMLTVLKMAGTGWLPAFAGPDQVYNLAHVDDIVRGVLRGCDPSLPSGSVFLLGGPQEHSAADLARALGQVLERPVRLLPLPRALLWSVALVSELWAAMLRRPAMLNRQKIPELTGNWSLDLSQAREGMGHEPTVLLEDGLRATVRWYRQRGWL
jgi:dihydroflavonol-4-reductase